MRLFFIVLFLLCSLILYNSAFSQVKSTTPPLKEGNKGEANNFYKNGDFKDALEHYLLLYAKDKENIDYNFRIGQCYLQLDEDKTKAIPFLEYVVKKDKTDKYPYVELGKAYHYANEFDKAMKAFETYLNSSKISPIIQEEVIKEIKECQNAKELMKFPVDVTFQNLGNKINTPDPDYCPFISDNEEVLIFNSKRGSRTSKAFQNFDGYNTPDVYVSFAKNGEWEEAKGLKMVNTEWVEEVVGISPDGERVFIYEESDLAYADLFSITKIKKTFKDFVNLGSPINSITTRETSATMTEDKSTIFFASNVLGGFGGSDIYMVRKLPNGEWSPPKNLGPIINTEYDEDFPSIFKDENILYFCSKGHTSMGGFDLFKSTYYEGTDTWSIPSNLGYPINDAYDNKTISFDETGRYGYISAYRKEGFGNLDIYKITSNDVEQKYTIIRGGFINGSDTISKAHGNLKKLPVIEMMVFDNSDGQLYGTYAPNPNTANYIMIIPFGDYQLNVNVDGVQVIDEQVKVLGLGSFKDEIIKYIYLNGKPPVENK